MISNFSKRFTYALDLRNKSMADISRETGINKASLSQYANGIYTPKQDRIFLIANALSVSPSWLMGFDTNLDGTENNPAYENDSTNIIFENQDFTVSSPTRVMKPNAEDFLSSSLYSMTEEREADEDRPSREEILIWLREHFRRAAYSGGDYESWPTEKLRKMYGELREQERKDEEEEK